MVDENFKALVFASLKDGPLTARAVAACLKESGLSWSVAYVTHRLEMGVVWGVLAKVLVGGKNHYLLADSLSAVRGADLNDPAERAMAADCLEEAGATQLASLLRRTSMVTYVF